MQVVNFVLENYQSILSGLVAVLGGVIAISLVIPGDQPEKSLQKVVDFLSKFSKK